MGDHRIILKVQFEMHGHKAQLDQWVNWTPDYPDKIRDWLQEQIEIGQGKFFDSQYDAEMVEKARSEHVEREELARLKMKYEQQ